MNRERAAFAAILLAIISALVVGSVAVWLWWASQDAACERTVETRSDARAMFEYLLGEADDPDDPDVIAFRDELDRRLPRLQCIDSRPTPIPAE